MREKILIILRQWIWFNWVNTFSILFLIDICCVMSFGKFLFSKIFFFALWYISIKIKVEREIKCYVTLKFFLFPLSIYTYSYLTYVEKRICLSILTSIYYSFSHKIYLHNLIYHASFVVWCICSFMTTHHGLVSNIVLTSIHHFRKLNRETSISFWNVLFAEGLCF